MSPLDDQDVKTGTLKVKKWLTTIQDNGLDLVAEMDTKMRHKQVGGLGEQSCFALLPKNMDLKYRLQDLRWKTFTIAVVKRPFLSSGILVV